MVALSNTQPVAAAPGSKDGTTLKKFDRTPLMSPYLVAICVGVLKNRTMTSEGFLYQVVGWATPDLEWQLDSGMQVCRLPPPFPWEVQRGRQICEQICKQICKDVGSF